MSDRPESTHWNAQLYDDKHAFVWEHGTSVVQWLGPKAGERILDLGCGTGQLTASIVKSGAEAVGMDSSATMLAEADQNYPMIELVHADAREFHFDKPFDAVFSNAVLHWITDPSRVVVCIAKALKPGGRLIAEFGGAGNVARLVDALRQAARDITGNTIEHGPYYPTIGQFCSVLNNCQLETTQALLFDRPTKLEGVDRLSNWIQMSGGRWLDTIPAVHHEDYFRRAEELARPHLMIDGQWYADYRRLRVSAKKVR